MSVLRYQGTSAVALAGLISGAGQGCSNGGAPPCSHPPPTDAGIALYVTRPVADASLARAESTEGELEAALLADLTAAGFSIDAALYSLNRENIVSALLQAQARGVSVRLVTECEQRWGDSVESFDRLEAQGIAVVDDRSSFHGTDPNCPEDGGTMHDKFWIVDRQTVWMGSTNMTWTGFNYNHNHAVRVQAPSIVTTYEEEFERLVSGTFGRDKQGSLLRSHVVGGVPVVTAFSPYGYDTTPVTQALVLGAITDAQQSIRFAMFYFTDAVIRQAIEEKGGLSQGLLDATGAAYSGSEHAALCAAGIDVKIENFPGKVHHKLGIFDARTDAAQVVLGSANWTSSGFSYNDESLLLVSSTLVAQQASLAYEALYDDPVNEGLACCNHSAESYNENSAWCEGAPCVCTDGIDNDYDGAADASDRGCTMPLACQQ